MCLSQSQMRSWSARDQARDTLLKFLGVRGHRAWEYHDAAAPSAAAPSAAPTAPAPARQGWAVKALRQAASSSSSAPAASAASSSPFFLASAPVSELDLAKKLVLARGGQYAAGDADDIFNSMTLHDQESWKVGWKGKIEATINILKSMNPGKEVWALAIAGGDACDWERKELRVTFCKNHPELKLKQLGDVEDLKFWLDRVHPRRR